MDVHCSIRRRGDAQPRRWRLVAQFSMSEVPRTLLRPWAPSAVRRAASCIVLAVLWADVAQVGW